MRLLRRIFKLFFFVLTLITVLIAYLIYINIQDLPDIRDVKKISDMQTSKIYSSDGVLLANLFPENRVIVSINFVSPLLVDAVVAVEDERFFEHPGVDITSIFRAFAAGLRSGEIRQGGSTISQQYIKNAYFSNEQTIGRKIKEAVLAFKIERELTKREILEKYLNTVYFGSGAYGVETASKQFFGKSAKDLTLEEAATLAGIIRNPAKYSPYTNPEASLLRRDYVLKKMLKLKKISKNTYRKATVQPLVAKPLVKKRYKVTDYFIENVRKELYSTYGEDIVLRGGLKVITTLDSRLQKIAEKAAFNDLNRPGDPSVALIALDVNSGAIRAMVGGKDFNSSKFNLATQSRRQPGSAFKTILLATAISKGISPQKKYKADSSLVIKLPGKKWEVSNYEGIGEKEMTLRDATIYSVNTVFAQLIMDIGPNEVVGMAKNLGITTQIEPDPIIALGGLKTGVSPLEMAVAYMSFANGGYRYNPYNVQKITDLTGRTFSYTQPVRQQVIDTKLAYSVTEILKDVIRKGTGFRANAGGEIAGKTGTTQNYADAWFIGYTPELATSIWVGYPDKKIPMKNIHGKKITGGTYPAQIWKDFITGTRKYLPSGRKFYTD